MHTTMLRKIYPWLGTALALFFLSLAPIQKAQASHATAVDMWWDCTGVPGEYIIHVVGYFDCGGILPNSFENGRLTNFSMIPSAGCNFTWLDTEWQYESAPLFNTYPAANCTTPRQWSNHDDLCEVTLICPSLLDSTSCNTNLNNAPYQGFVGLHLYRRISLDPGCSYTLEYEIGTRSADILNVVNSGSENSYSDLTINVPPAGQPCNASPRFIFPPSNVLCLNRETEIDASAVDPDGDSLVYSIDTCYGRNRQPLTYSQGFTNPGYPFPASGTFGCGTIPPLCITQNGKVPLRPLPHPPGHPNQPPGGQAPLYTFCVRVEAFDPVTGQKTGETRREMTVQTLPEAECSDPPIITTVADTAISPNNTVFRDTICVNQLFSVKFEADDRDGDSLFYEIALDDDPQNWSATLPPTKEFQPEGEVFYTPTVARSQPFKLVVAVQDNGCTFPQRSIYEFNIFVVDKPIPVITSTPTGCNEVDFNISFQGASASTFDWNISGDENLAAPNPGATNFTFEYDGPGVKNWTLFARLDDCDTVINGSVVVPQTAARKSPTGTVTACGAADFVLGGQDSITVPQTYTWTQTSGPAIPISDTTNQRPILSLPSVTATDTVTFALQVANDAGCVTEDTATLYIIPNPQAPISGSNIVCEGDTVRLGGPPNMSQYFWSTGDTTRDIVFVPTQSTSVSLTVADDIGCRSPANTRNITVQPPPTAQVFGDTVYCLGDTATLTALGAQNYFWEDNTGLLDTTPSVQVVPDTTPQTYFVTPVSNNCQGPLSAVTVRAYPYPTAGIQLNSPQVQCFGETSFNFQATGSVGDDYEHQWHFGKDALPAVADSNIVLGVNYLSPGDKTVWLFTIDTRSGCVSDTDSITVRVVDPPRPDIGDIPAQCWDNGFNSYDFTYTGSPADSFFWFFDSVATPLSSNEENPRNVSFADPGLHPITVTATIEVCSETARANVRVLENPEPPEMQNDTICQGYRAEPFVVDPDGRLRYLWYNTDEATDSIFEGDAYRTPRLDFTLTYYVESVNRVTANWPVGCVSLSRTPVAVFVDSAPQVDIDVDTNLVWIPNTTVNFSPESSHPLEHFLWNFGDGGTSTQEAPAHTYERPGFYTVTLTGTDSNNCVGSVIRSDLIEVREDIFVRIPTGFSPNNDYQNDYLYLWTNLINTLQFRVFDRWGQLVASFDDPNFRWDGRDLEGNALTEGVYIYHMEATTYTGEDLVKEGTITLFR